MLLTAGPVNLQSVPSPLLFLGRRRTEAVFPRRAFARAEALTALYAPAPVASPVETARAGSSVLGDVRVTATGAERITDTGALRVRRLSAKPAALVSPILSVSVRSEALTALYTAGPVASPVETARAGSSALAASYQAAALYSPVVPVSTRAEIRPAAYQAAGIVTAARSARQRSEALAAVYAPA